MLLESNQQRIQSGLRDRQCEYWRNMVPQLRRAVAASSAGRHKDAITEDAPSISFRLLRFHLKFQLMVRLI